MELFSTTFLQELKTEIAGEVVNQLSGLITQTQTPKPQTEYLTRREAAHLLGVSLPTLNEWSKNGTVKGYRIASRVRYKRAELEQSLSQFKTGR